MSTPRGARGVAFCIHSEYHYMDGCPYKGCGAPCDDGDDPAEGLPENVGVRVCTAGHRTHYWTTDERPASMVGNVTTEKR